MGSKRTECGAEFDLWSQPGLCSRLRGLGDWGSRPAFDRPGPATPDTRQSSFTQRSSPDPITSPQFSKLRITLHLLPDFPVRARRWTGLPA